MGRKRFSRAGSGNTWPWLMQGISIPARLCRSGIYSCDADDHRFESTVVRGTGSLVSGSMKKDDPGRVSGGGFGALMAGNDLAVAGSVRLQVAGAGVLPDTMKGELHAKLTGPRV